jgi:hypothetical protein
MDWKLLYFFILIIVVTILQLVLGGNFGFFAGRVNLILVVLAVLINLNDFKLLLVFAIGTGLLLDVYSALPFGIITLTLFFTAVLCQFLFLNFFTNFSFYSLASLSVIAVLIYHLLLSAIVFFLYFIGLSDVLPKVDYLVKVGWQFITTLILITVSYKFINSISRKFNPNFIN